MAKYLATITQTVLIDAESSGEARAKVEPAFYARPGFDKDVRRAFRLQGIKIEKV